MKKIFLHVLLSIISFSGFSAVIVVDSINDAGVGSLRQAIIDANNGDSITFNPNLIAGGNNTITLTSGEIAFTKNLTIIGLITATDTLFLSGNNMSRIFKMTSGTTTLEKMAIVDGLSTDSHGGGVYAHILHVKSSIIRSNTAASTLIFGSTFGGGIYAYNLTLENTTLSENKVTSGSFSAVGGGASSTYLSINNSSIINNSVISASPSDGARGGGVRGEHITINNSTISGNLADGNKTEGGGVYAVGNLTIANSIINNNTAYSFSTYGAFGGGVHAYANSNSTTFLIDNTTFSGNKASSITSEASGGGIYAKSNSVSSTGFSTLEIKNSTLVGDTVINTSDVSGGISGGGGLYAEDISVIFDNSIVDGNVAVSPYAAQGGAINVSTSNSSTNSVCGLTILNSTVSGNSGSSPTFANGGGIYAASISYSSTSSSSGLDVLIDNSLISNNTISSTDAITHGGGIYTRASASSNSYNSAINLTINNSTVSGNSSHSATTTAYGGGIYGLNYTHSSTSFFTINHSTISGNVASTFNGGAAGGGIYTRPSFNSSFTLSCSHSTISNNTATTSSTNPNTSAIAGGIWNAGTGDETLILKNCTVTGNLVSSNTTAVAAGVYAGTSATGSLFTLGSNIIAGNIGDNEVTGLITTNDGYNIFGDAPTGAVATDQINVAIGTLNLGLLQNNGGHTFTMAPNSGSVAINMGEPSDASNAQNGTIIGIRDVGAAENGIIACPTIYDTLNLEICHGDTYTFGGNLLVNSGLYKDTLTSTNGCDSITTLNLIVNGILTSAEKQAVCGNSYTWIDGNTYTTNTTLPTDTLTSISGCDSIVTLYLILDSAETAMDVITGCDSYTWIDGNTYTANNSTATYTLPNLNGCDSTVTLNLTIAHPVTGTDTQVACNIYTWIDGNTYGASNNNATYTLMSAEGCDSVVSLDLTINSVGAATTTVNANTITVFTNEPNPTYQWVDCNDGNAPVSGATDQSFTPLINGNYAVIVTSNNCTKKSGCNFIIAGLDVHETLKAGTSIYPNPTLGSFNIELGNNTGVNIEITNSIGQIIYVLDNVMTSQINIETDHFSKGIYFVKIQDEKEQVVIRLIKQ